MKVFLGGTCNGSTWRDEIIPLLKIDYFNPVVDDWTPEHQKEEILQRETCNLLLYVIHLGLMKGIYSIAEATADSIINPDKTVICVIGKGDEGMNRSVKAFTDLCESHGATILNSLEEVVDHLNYFHELFHE